MSDRPAPVGRAGSDAIALGFVALALVLLLVVPVLTERRAAILREDLEEVAEPARDAITRAQFQLAREMSNLRAYLLTSDTVFLRRYATIAMEQEATLRELDELAVRLGPSTAEGAATLRERVDRWQQSVGIGDLAGTADRPRDAVMLDQRLYEQATASAAALDQSVGALSRELRQQIRRVERAAFLLTLTLGGLAVVAVGLLVRFGRRLRALAAEAEVRRGEAQRALDATREALEARDRLVRGVTHDVKNPLGAADGYAEILQLGLRGPLTAEQSGTVDGIRRSLRSALGIIEDLLDLARAERGHLPITVREVSLNDVVSTAAEAHRGALEAVGQGLELSLPSTPILTRTDPSRVEQVLGNLFSNAAKYGGHGTVRVTLEWDAGSAGGVREWAAIVVTDSGAGIPPDQLESIFTEFHRVDPADRRGHGVGLAISRHVARQLGGDLLVRNADGGGAAFTLRIPLDRRAGPAPGAAPQRG